MTTYSTQNPLGSADPRDLYDNAENLDVAVNTTEDRWTDRLGNERVSLASAVDPTGFAQSALNDANRAEAAADAAFVNADVYDDVATGLAATDEGEQFQVVEGAEIVRYRNESGSAVEVARYPASEFVNIALDVASQPGLVSGEFYTDDDEQPVYSITDEDGNALAVWDQQGEMDAAPSLDMAEKSQRARAEFHTEDGQPAFALTDEEGRPLYAVDENVQPIVPWLSEFHVAPGIPMFGKVNSDSYLFIAWDENGQQVIGGGGQADYKNLPFRDTDTAPNTLWKNDLKLEVSRERGAFFNENIYELFPDHLSIYAFLDGLQAEFPDYITSSVLGQDSGGYDIRQYRLTPDVYREVDSSYLSADLPLPKLILVGLTHGNEPQAAMANIIMVEELCRKWMEYPEVSAIRWGFDICFIPVLCPWGYDNRDRRNADNVNINRNFPTGWDDAASDRGPSPASEPETQVMIAYADQHSDASGLIDHHRMFGLNSPSTGGIFVWIGARGNTTLGVAMSAIQHLVAFGKKNFPLTVEWNPKARLTRTGDGTLSRHTQAAFDIDSFLLESSNNLLTTREQMIMMCRENVLTMTKILLERENRKRETLFTNPDIDGAEND